MDTKAVTTQNCSLFEIDAELEAAFDQMQEEREITGNVSEESRIVRRAAWNSRKSCLAFTRRLMAR